MLTFLRTFETIFWSGYTTTRCSYKQCRSSSSAISLPKVGMVTLTDSTCSWGCTVVHNCGFSSHFPNDNEHLFTCLSFISLSWNVYSNFPPIFSLGYLHYFLFLSFKFFLYFKYVSYQVSDLQMFPPHLCMSFSFLNVVFRRDEVQFIIFLSWVVLLIYIYEIFD